MTLDRVENGEYILQNSDFKNHSPGKKSSFPRNKARSVIRIPLKNPYYVTFGFVFDLDNRTQSNIYEDSEIKLAVVNEQFGNMDENKWYLHSEAYTIELSPS